MRLTTISLSALRGGRWFVTQVAVAVAATFCVASLFPSAKTPASPSVPTLADGTKSSQRVGNGGVDQTVLRFDPQQQAALASIASFTPQAFTGTPPVAVSPVTAVAARTAQAAKPIAPMPPQRRAPAQANAAGPVAAPAVSAEGKARENRNWSVAGVDIPGSAVIRAYVPSGSDIVATGNNAWSATTSLTKSVAGKVADFGGRLGL